MTRSTSTRPVSRGFELHYFATIVGILALCTGLLYVRAIATGGFLAADNANAFVNMWTVAGLISAASIGTLIGLHWQRLGGLIALIAGLAAAVITFFLFDENQLMAMFIYGSPFIIAGGLYLVDWALRRRARGVQIE